MPIVHPELVFQGMSQAELDAQYDQRSLVPDISGYVSHWRKTTSVAKRAHGATSHRYGDGPDEILDFYATDTGAPLHLHLHGGAWRLLSKDEAGFVAASLNPDMAVAVLDFANATVSSLPAMVDQVRRGFAWLATNAAGLGVATGPIFVSGHSSGAHLAACLLDPVWRRSVDLSEDALGGLVLVSGVYDLEPVRLSARNDYLRISADEVAALSPIRNLPATVPPIAVLWGDGELEEFKRQSREFAAMCAERGGEVIASELVGQNHFDMYNAFGDRNSRIVKAALAHAQSVREAPAEMGPTR